MNRVDEINSDLYDLDFQEKKAIDEFRFDDAIEAVKTKNSLRDEKIQLINTNIQAYEN